MYCIVSQIYQTVFKVPCPKNVSSPPLFLTQSKTKSINNNNKKGLARILYNPVKFLTSYFQTHTFLLTMSLFSIVCHYIVTKEAAKTLICYREYFTTIKGRQEKETMTPARSSRTSSWLTYITWRRRSASWQVRNLIFDI